MLLSFAAWLTPLHAAIALKQNYEAEAIFINYEQFHESVRIQQHPKLDAPKAKQRTIPVIVGKNSTYSGRNYSKEEVTQLIKDYSLQYGINPDVPLCIAKWESGYNHLSRNKSSSASGVFQYLSRTWKSTDEGKTGLSVFDAEANIKAAIKYMASRRSLQPWEVRNKCPKLTSQ